MKINLHPTSEHTLRATGFRAEAYDLLVKYNLLQKMLLYGLPTGRQVIQVGGTTLTGVPVEDYIIKIDGYTSADPAVEHIILETELSLVHPQHRLLLRLRQTVQWTFSWH